MKNNAYISFFKVITIVFIVTNLNLSYSQIIQNETYDKFLNEFNSSNSKSVKTKINKKEITGSPYLSEEFTLGNIITTQNVQYSNIPLRYNIYTDEMEFKTKENSTFAFPNTVIIKEVQLGEDIFIYCRAKNKKGGYYSLKSSREVQLLSKYHVTFQAATPSLAYKKASPPHYLRNFNEFYIRIVEENKLVHITKKKDLKSILGDKNDVLFAFIKKEKIKLRREKGLVKLVKFINTII